MITLIVLAIIGWVINLTLGIKTMVDGWKRGDREAIEFGGFVTIVGLLFGFVVGWVMLVKGIKAKYIDKHFK